MGISTIDARAVEAHLRTGWRVPETRVTAHTPAEIVRDDIHFVKIDESGERAAVLVTDYAAFPPWIILVEEIRPLPTEQNHDEWQDLLTDGDYRFAWFDGLNRFYIATELWEGLSLALSLRFHSSLRD